MVVFFYSIIIINQVIWLAASTNPTYLFAKPPIFVRCDYPQEHIRLVGICTELINLHKSIQILRVVLKVSSAHQWPLVETTLMPAPFNAEVPRVRHPTIVPSIQLRSTHPVCARLRQKAGHSPSLANHRNARAAIA